MLQQMLYTEIKNTLKATHQEFKKTAVQEERNDNAHKNCHQKVRRFSPAGILWKKTFK